MTHRQYAQGPVHSGNDYWLETAFIQIEPFLSAYFEIRRDCQRQKLLSDAVYLVRLDPTFAGHAYLFIEVSDLT